MPAYNEECQIGEAIESVLNQSYPDFELIVIDDGSTDSTGEVVRGYAVRDPRVRLFRNEKNSRLGPIEWEPRNDGLKFVNGSFVSYLDADNMWDSRFLSCMLEAFQRGTVQLAYCDSRNFYSKEEKEAVVLSDARTLTDSGPDWTVYSVPSVDPRYLGTTQYIDTNEIMHRAAVFDSLGHLWRTHHPRRSQINRHQGGGPRPHRRHNDLALVQDIIACFGVEGVHHVPLVLVNFFYRSFRRQSGRDLE